MSWRRLRIERAKKLFGAEHANVQPHSGSQANHGRLRRRAPARRHHSGHEPFARRPPHARHPVELFRQAVQIVPYGVRREDEQIDYDELARLAEEHKPKMIIAGGSAYPRIIDFARFRADRRFGGRHFPGGYGALLRAGRGGRAPEPVRVRRHRDFHHAQDAARPPLRHDPVPAQKYRAGRSIKPCSPACRAARGDIIAAKAVCFLEAMQPEFNEYQKQVMANARRSPRHRRGRLPRRLRRHRYALLLVDVFAKGIAARKPRRRSTRRTSPPTRIPSRSIRTAVQSQRNPPGQPGRDHARLPRTGDARGRHADRRGAEQHRLRGDARRRAPAGRGSHRKVPALRLETQSRRGP